MPVPHLRAAACLLQVWWAEGQWWCFGKALPKVFPCPTGGSTLHPLPRNALAFEEGV